MKILVIEDNRADFVILKNMLEESTNEKHNIEWVSRLGKGLDLLKKESFDVVLLDLGLPDSNGLDTFTEFYSAFNNIPVIILSGNDNEDVAISAVRIGAQDYLAKNNLQSQVLKRSIRYAVERQQTVEALAQSEAKFRIIFDEALDVIMIIDSYTGIIQHVNPAAFHVMGYKKKHLIGKHFSKIMPQDTIVTRVDLINKVLVNGAVFESQLFQKEDGSPISMDISATIIPWGKGNAILLSLRDATERYNIEQSIYHLNKQLERRVVERTEQLEATLAELKNEITFRNKAEEKLAEAKNEITKAWSREHQLSELKTKFIKTVSNDYLSPLDSIYSSAEFLDLYEKTNDPESFRKHLNNIMNAVDSMTKLLENVLTIEAVQSGTYNLKYNYININSFVESILDNCAFLDKNRHPIELEKVEDNALVYIEHELTKSIIFNLCNNALKFSDDGKRVEVRVEKYMDTLSVRISDTGKGMTSEEIERVEQLFTSNDPNLSVDGFGIGLNIVNACSRLIGADIKFNSQYGRGTTVLVEIPIEEPKG